MKKRLFFSVCNFYSLFDYVSCFTKLPGAV